MGMSLEPMHASPHAVAHDPESTNPVCIFIAVFSQSLRCLPTFFVFSALSAALFAARTHKMVVEM
jgi:hypothetical protein